MSGLRVLRLNIPGEWSDGWLYKEHLILWSRTGRMHVVPVRELVRAIHQEATPGVAVAADYLLFRNDWKISDQFRRMISVPGVQEAFLRDLAPDGQITIINMEPVEPVLIETEETPGVGLDSAIYANRVYIGSTEGLFETYFNPNNAYDATPLIRRLEHRTVSVSAKYMSVNGSAEDAGLWFSPVRFEEDNWDEDSWLTTGDAENEWEQVADVSWANSFASRHLLNYTDDAFPTFLRSESVRRRTHSRAQYDEWTITGYQQQTDITGLMRATISPARDFKLFASGQDTYRDEEGESPVVLGNSNYRLLVAWQGGLKVVDISAFPGKEIAAKLDSDFRRVDDISINPADVLGTYALGSGFLVEFFGEARLITATGSYPLVNEQAARIRTFTHSKRHRDTVLFVGEKGISLFGFFESRDQSHLEAQMY